MTQSYPIPARLAERAAQDYLLIVREGFEFELQREIEEAIQAHYGPMPDRTSTIGEWNAYHARKLDRWQNGNAWQLRQAESRAEQLADLLDCEPHEVAPYIVPELLGGETRRAIVLTAIHQIASYIRRQHNTTARRRSA